MIGGIGSLLSGAASLGSMIGGLFGEGGGDSSDAINAAVERAIAFTREMYGKFEETSKPYRDVGKEGLTALRDLFLGEGDIGTKILEKSPIYKGLRDEATEQYARKASALGLGPSGAGASGLPKVIADTAMRTAYSPFIQGTEYMGTLGGQLTGQLGAAGLGAASNVTSALMQGAQLGLSNQAMQNQVAQQNQGNYGFGLGLLGSGINQLFSSFGQSNYGGSGVGSMGLGMPTAWSPPTGYNYNSPSGYSYNYSYS